MWNNFYQRQTHTHKQTNSHQSKNRPVSSTQLDEWWENGKSANSTKTYLIQILNLHRIFEHSISRLDSLGFERVLLVFALILLHLSVPWEENRSTAFVQFSVRTTFTWKGHLNWFAGSTRQRLPVTESLFDKTYDSVHDCSRVQGARTGRNVAGSRETGRFHYVAFHLHAFDLGVSGLLYLHNAMEITWAADIHAACGLRLYNTFYLQQFFVLHWCGVCNAVRALFSPLVHCLHDWHDWRLLAERKNAVLANMELRL